MLILEVKWTNEAKFNKKEPIDKKIVEKYFDIVNFIDSLAKKMIKNVEQTQI